MHVIRYVHGSIKRFVLNAPTPAFCLFIFVISAGFELGSSDVKASTLTT